MTPAKKLTEKRRQELWEVVELCWGADITPDKTPNFHDEVWETLSRKFGFEIEVGETDDFLWMWEEYHTHELVKTLKMLRSSMFMEVADKHGPEFASQHPDIVAADAVLGKHRDMVLFWRAK